MKPKYYIYPNKKPEEGSTIICYFFRIGVVVRKDVVYMAKESTIIFKETLLRFNQLWRYA